MIWLYILASIAIFVQMFFLFQVFRNYKYALSKSRKQRDKYIPKTALIVPCKGLDTEFEKNVASFYNQDYANYELIFVVESRSDPAYEKLCALKDVYGADSQVLDVRILTAGVASHGSQKLCNLLCAYRNISVGVEILAFADSDACLRSDWLGHIVYPLRKQKAGAASGYRWFVPIRNNLATLAMSAMNAKVAQNLGASRFNQAWGGSMAIRVELFAQLGLDKIWETAVSDDLTLSRAVKQAGKKVVFVPACLVASYEQTTWPKLFEFARRQFLITRITMPGTWWFAFFSAFFSVLGFWGFAAVSLFSFFAEAGYWSIFALTAVLLLGCQLLRAVLRQRMIFNVLSADVPRMRTSAAADLLGGPIWSCLMFLCIASSAFGKVINWRGIRYKLLNPSEAIRIRGK